MAGWFAYIYFAAGLAKLFPVIKGLSWLNGQTSKEIIYYRYLDSPFHYLFGRPFFDYSENTIVFAALTVGALVLELFTGIMFLTARFNVLILTLLIAMHLFLYMTGVAGFTQTALVLGIAVLPSHWFKDTRSIG